jgi:hypothetical protein
MVDVFDIYVTKSEQIRLASRAVARKRIELIGYV